ncbi:FAD-dependent oxidoreductase [Nocardioides sp.]|uniref:NAD(P)/FAD-dependent oxidoreductase n=1 Tax=Nocardioides sp. TaxID=35761 RepID=UPI0031FE6A90|nr:FAD-dependent pyridine nucleotide-disulfide oxidoreductase [Nocardioides sp.]
MITRSTSPQRIVVVGFGAAALAACQELRALGWSGDLTILSQESTWPYDRPPLTKGYLTGQMSRDRLDLADNDGIAGLDADVRLGVCGARLVVDEHRLEDSAGTIHTYDALVIATGVRPRRLPGTDARNTYALRTVLDADRLRIALTGAKNLVVVGGGFLGFEVAGSARTLGVEVTVIEPLRIPLADRLGTTIATRLLSLHQENGVRVLASTSVAEVSQVSQDVVVRLQNGQTLATDVVLEAIGCVPDTAWLEGSGLDLRDGIVCDAWSRAAPDVFAAGDVAKWRHLGLRRDVRVEHRMNATEHGRAVAGAILGHGVPYTPVPFVWTDHYGVRIQVAGIVQPEGIPLLLQGDPEDDTFVVGWQGNQLEAAAGWNAARELMPYRRQLAATIGRPDVTEEGA